MAGWTALRCAASGYVGDFPLSVLMWPAGDGRGVDLARADIQLHLRRCDKGLNDALLYVMSCQCAQYSKSFFYMYINSDIVLFADIASAFTYVGRAVFDAR